MNIPDQTAMRKQLIEALGLSPEYFYDSTWEDLLQLVRKQTTLLTKLSALLDKL